MFRAWQKTRRPLERTSARQLSGASAQLQVVVVTFCWVVTHPGLSDPEYDARDPEQKASERKNSWHGVDPLCASGESVGEGYGLGAGDEALPREPLKRLPCAGYWTRLSF